MTKVPQISNGEARSQIGVVYSKVQVFNKYAHCFLVVEAK